MVAPAAHTAGTCNRTEHQALRLQPEDHRSSRQLSRAQTLVDLRERPHTGDVHWSTGVRSDRESIRAEGIGASPASILPSDRYVLAGRVGSNGPTVGGSDSEPPGAAENVQIALNSPTSFARCGPRPWSVRWSSVHSGGHARRNKPRPATPGHDPRSQPCRRACPRTNSDRSAAPGQWPTGKGQESPSHRASQRR